MNVVSVPTSLFLDLGAEKQAEKKGPMPRSSL
jgi:hypothetical protein